MATTVGSGTRMIHQVHVPTPQLEGVVIKAGPKKTNPLPSENLPTFQWHEVIRVFGSGCLY